MNEMNDMEPFKRRRSLRDTLNEIKKKKYIDNYEDNYEEDNDVDSYEEDNYVIDSFIDDDIQYNDNWKTNLSSSDVTKVEGELLRIREIIKNEIPTIPKIINSNITESDKIKCIKLYDQLQNIEPFTEEYDNKVIQINNILSKSDRYTKEEIQYIDNESKRLKTTSSDDINIQIIKLNASDKVKKVLYNQYLSMLEYEPGSSGYNSIREELEWSLRLPHNTSHKMVDLTGLSNIELNKIYKNYMTLMDKKLYGMKNIKLKILHIYNDRRKSGNICGRNIAVVGPPGTGKTVVGEVISEILGLPFEKISLGGMDDASILKGSDKVWDSSSPSIVLQILSRIKSSSGVIMFDELDKLGETPKGKEVQYALLHISDYVHNKEFRDNYLNKYPHDFSKILFIYCANKIDTLDSALLNRLDIIYTRPYSLEEKKIITTDYVLPKVLSSLNMKLNSITIDKKSLDLLLKDSTDPGVRDIEKMVKELVGKINMYNSVVLNDGTTGDLDLGYTIPNFKLPIVINNKLLKLIENNI